METKVKVGFALILISLVTLALIGFILLAAAGV
jgi:hypothetical protein